MPDGYTTITTAQLSQTLDSGPPENDARDEGYALVNVLPQEQFQSEHIPGSINIPKEQIGRFEDRFGKDKKIVVYCASPECPASSEAANSLAERGFRHLYDYEAGLSAWREAGNPIEGTRSSTGTD